jgi:hypothetical protein
MYVKIMGDENAPDSDPRKTFNIYAVDSAEFYRDSEGRARVFLNRSVDGVEGDEDLPVIGNAYIMNAEGKTIASMGSAPLPEPTDKPDTEMEAGER